jgi:hypothetical protein
MLPYMTFPVEEWAALRQRLNEGKPIFTTRISMERERYREGQQVASPLGVLFVDEVRQYANLDEHPFLSELTPAQIRIIQRAGAFAVIKLSAT